MQNLKRIFVTGLIGTLVLFTTSLLEPSQATTTYNFESSLESWRDCQ